jgi:hypothetical protein
MDPVKASADPLLRWVVTRSAIVAVVATLGSLAFWRVDVTAGVGLGAIIALANFWTLRWLMGRAVERTAATAQRAGAGFLLTFKFALLVGAIYALLRLLPIDPIALMAGLSVVVVVILAGPVLGPPVGAATEK